MLVRIVRGCECLYVEPYDPTEEAEVARIVGHMLLPIEVPDELVAQFRDASAALSKAREALDDYGVSEVVWLQVPTG